MMNVPYVVLKYATLLLSFPVNNVVEVVLTTLTAVLKSTNYKSSSSSHLHSAIQGIKQIATIQRMKTVFTNTPKTPKQQQYIVTLHYFLVLLFFGYNTNADNGNT